MSEDLGAGDLITDALIPPGLMGRGVAVARAEGVLAGLDVALEVFRRVDPALQLKALLKDGAMLGLKSLVAEVEGSVASMLMAERTTLNFLQRLSGIATVTSRYVKAVKGYPVRILDTRKTTPGLRTLEKYAVRVGGRA